MDGLRVVPVRIRRVLPTGGVTGLLSLRLTRRLRTHLQTYDVAHIHLGRDLMAATAGALAVARVPTVLQTHGMVMPDPRPRARVMDGMTIRRTLQGAGAVLYLTEPERAGLRQVAGGSLALRPLVNGISEGMATSRRELRPTQPTVLFCARLHARKRPLAFVELARELGARGITCSFLLAGPDDGELAQVRAAIAAARSAGTDIEYLGALSPSDARAALGDADVLVLPSDDEPYPMTVLEAMAAGTPPVITRSCGLAALIGTHSAGAVSDREVSALADAVAGLVTDRDRWSAASEAGTRLTASSLSIEQVVAELEAIYVDVAHVGPEASNGNS